MHWFASGAVKTKDQNKFFFNCDTVKKVFQTCLDTMLAKVRSKLLHSSDINIILLVYQGLFSSLYWQLTLLSRTPKCAIDFYSQLFSMALFTSRESNKTLQNRRWEAGNLLLLLPPLFIYSCQQKDFSKLLWAFPF